MITDKQRKMLEVVFGHGHMDVSLAELIDEEFIELVKKQFFVVSKTYTGVVVAINPNRMEATKDLIN